MWACRQPEAQTEVARLPTPVARLDAGRAPVQCGRILDLNPHIVVLKLSMDFQEYRDTRETILKDPDVLAAEPFVVEQTRATSARQTQALIVKGVDPSLVSQVIGLDSCVLAAPAQPPPIILADTVAHALGVHVDDDITVKPSDGAPAHFRVRAVFHSTLKADQIAFTTIEAMQRLLGRGDTVSGIEIRIRDPEQSGDVAKRLGRSLPDARYQPYDWRMLFNLRDAGP
jgi:lipoprotein-releasing system permease protein